MKKILATFALLLGALHILSAVPAYPGKIRMTQPDGSVITIRLHGDEWFHYATDESGQVVARDADGFYRPAPMPTPAEREEAVQMRKAAQQMRQSMAKASSLSIGTHRIPVVLVNFSDKEFVTADPNTAFSNMLNQEGYSANGGTGSVHDYYYENSHGAYDPVFEVFGPVTLSNTSAYFTDRASAALKEACKLLDSEIDFSQYDSDSDGSVDMILMYYAGYNQAEGGGEDTIWPHQSYASGYFDGKSLSRYFCTSELRGFMGNRMCGIGTTSHEFGHSLGLPDFYDTDYEKNGQAGALYTYSIMCSGSYNNNGCTPPYLNSEELKILGWMEDQTPVTEKGTLTIEPVQNYVAYRTEASKDGEYFVYECRKQAGWDRYIAGGGLLVYHVDKSQNEVVITQTDWSGADRDYTYTAYDLWNNWTYSNVINAKGSHPCFYLVPAASQQSLNYTGREYNIPFPGNQNIKKYTPVDWEGEEGAYRFSEIAFDGEQVTMTVAYNSVPGIKGTVMNTSAKPIRGAVVTLRSLTETSSAPAGVMAVRRAQGQPLMTVTTDVDGTFQFEDESLADATFLVSVACDGYVETEARVTVGRLIVTQDFYLRKVGESEESTFCFYDPSSSSFSGLGYGSSGSSLAASIHISSEMATAHAGKQLKLISFQLFGDETSSADAVYVFVEAENRRKFTQKVDNPKFGEMNTVNVIGQEYFIPSGQELYIGYGLVNASETYPLLVQQCTEENMGYMGTFNVSRATTWSAMSISDGTMFTPVISAAVGERVEPELGFNYIANPGNGTYAAGARFELALVRYEGGEPSSVSWTFDGQAVQAGSVTLTAGNHAVEAHLTYPDGAVEVIRLVIHAE